MKERLKDRRGLFCPIPVGLHLKSFPRSTRYNLQKPRVDPLALIVSAQCLHNALRHRLQLIDFETMVVETVKRILETPVSIGLLKQFLQCRKVGFERLEEFLALAVDVVPRCWFLHGLLEYSN